MGIFGREGRRDSQPSNQEEDSLLRTQEGRSTEKRMVPTRGPDPPGSSGKTCWRARSSCWNSCSGHGGDRAILPAGETREEGHPHPGAL